MDGSGRLLYQSLHRKTLDGICVKVYTIMLVYTEIHKFSIQTFKLNIAVSAKAGAS